MESDRDWNIKTGLTWHGVGNLDHFERQFDENRKAWLAAQAELEAQNFIARYAIRRGLSVREYLRIVTEHRIR